MNGDELRPFLSADGPDLGCIACRMGSFHAVPPCTWCGGTGTVILSPSQRIVFMRLRAYYISIGHERPDVHAQHDVKGHGLATSMRSSEGMRTARGQRTGLTRSERRQRARPHWMLERVCLGLTASEMVELMRTVCWLEDRGL